MKKYEERGLKYLKERRIGEETFRKFGGKILPPYNEVLYGYYDTESVRIVSRLFEILYKALLRDIGNEQSKKLFSRYREGLEKDTLYLLFPLRDTEGIVRGYHVRVIYPESLLSVPYVLLPRYINIPVSDYFLPYYAYNEKLFDKEYFFITEGIFDIMTVFELYEKVLHNDKLFVNVPEEKINFIATLGVMRTRSVLKRLPPRSMLIFVPDNDEGGQKMLEDAYDYRNMFDMKVLLYPPEKDINALVSKGKSFLYNITSLEEGITVLSPRGYLALLLLTNKQSWERRRWK